MERNVTTNVASIEFTRAFKDCMFVDIGKEEFEHKWNSIMERLCLEENAWVQKNVSQENYIGSGISPWKDVC